MIFRVFLANFVTQGRMERPMDGWTDVRSQSLIYREMRPDVSYYVRSAYLQRPFGLKAQYGFLVLMMAKTVGEYSEPST